MTELTTQEAILTKLQEPYGTYREIIHGWAEVRADKPALRDENVTLTWREVADRVERIAFRLQQTGLQQGQSVAILGTSTANYALVFLAAVVAGGVAAPLTTSASPAQLEGMAKDSGARHLFIDRAKLAELGDGFMSGLDRIVLDEELDEWMAPEGEVSSPFIPRGDEPFNIIYSSGTTGIPKGIVHSHKMRWFQFAPTAGRAYSPEAKALASTPLYSNTTMVCFLSSVLAGACTTIMGKFDTRKWLETAQRDGTTHTMLVPVQYQRLMDEPAFDDFDLSTLALKYCTSAPFSAELKAQVVGRMPGALIEIYGMTEGGVTCLLYAHEHPTKLHTVGQPAPGHALKVLDDHDREVPAGTPGNLVGISPAMMVGYKNREAATQESLWTNPEDGSVWMRMGDIGRIDEDGFVELVGRAKDMIISGGFNIYPVDLENELLKEAGVTEAAVIGVPSAKWGESPIGFVTLDPDAGTSTEIVMASVNNRLGKTQRLAQLHLIDEMPRSHIGKLLKTELRQRAEKIGLPD
ncbi:class I adenylate-forming enzyme family protein [Pontixanthobacter gangjinensis]|uniref:AMP-binding protein n=1 Tax=Pontixanthobacter gangjinensis TaxID=1028742 RepID=A0A6I4SKI6_9SPHN|nr:class I adenylate-forming enzyme family protein [Pontixanthobacter gangjinensis]MXO55968.1 AMP-binding protein [Pontixanthobacter gangjinensis]